MSGRDLRKFVNFHRNAIGASDSSLVTRFIEGHGSNRFRPADYDKLQAIAQLKKAAGNQTLQKIEKITKASKEKKEQQLLQQHRACWNKECIRLRSLQKKLERDIDSIRPGSPLDPTTLKEFFEDLERYEQILATDMVAFKENTIEPVWALREDIQFWLGENRDRLILGSVNEEHQKVVEVIESVKSQQSKIIQGLECEQTQLQLELEKGFLSHLSEWNTPMSEQTDDSKRGIPQEAQELECPDENLKTTVLEEFHFLDRKYEAHLEFLELKYNHVLHSSTGGWSKDEHFHFVCLLDQYPMELPNRHSLYIDRMLRELPHKTRTQLIAHEEWWLSYRFYQEQKQSTQVAWAAAREGLITKVKATFTDAWTAYEEVMEKKETRKKQQQICQELYEKVLAFREKKLEVLRLQAVIATQEQKEAEEKLKAAEEKEKQRREKIHQKVEVFQKQRQMEQEASAAAERRRLEELRMEMAEQARVDSERVKYREDELLKRNKAKLLAQQEVLETEREKERRLERLREQVRVHVESDPGRLLKPTQATQARVASIYEEELELQKPLFTLHGYDERKVAGDVRIKMEQALREAGLHQTEYGRKILSSVKPPSEPRRDHQSTVFKYD